MKLEMTKVERIKTGTDGLVTFAIRPEHRLDYRGLVRQAQPADLYDLVISLPKKHRTTGEWSQNHHLNGHVMQIANATGQDFEAIKLYVKRQAIARGLPLRQGPDGDILLSIVDGEPVPISEREMDTIQCGWCIEESHILAAELGIILREEP